MPTRMFAINDAGQGKADMSAVPRHNMPIIGIAEMPEHDFFDIDASVFFGSGAGRQASRKAEREKEDMQALFHDCAFSVLI